MKKLKDLNQLDRIEYYLEKEDYSLLHETLVYGLLTFIFFKMIAIHYFLIGNFDKFNSWNTTAINVPLLIFSSGIIIHIINKYFMRKKWFKEEK